jgi:6-phosphofructokinase 1
LMAQRLTLKEAGPRQKLVWPYERDELNIGILVSGGIAPGLNAVIDGITERHYKYKEEYEKKYNEDYNLNIYGYRDGFSGFCRSIRRIELTRESIREHRNQGGCIIGTSRFENLLDYDNPLERYKAIDAVIRRLRAESIDILYVIGGDGSMRAAHAIWTRLHLENEDQAQTRDISIVAIPKTMDNDVLWVWQTFGFLSAVEKAKEFVQHLITEAKSNPRLCIVQLFGSDSGFVVSHAALASGECSAALIPEADFSMKSLSDHIRKELISKRRHATQSPYGIIIAAETAIPWDVEQYLDDVEIGLEDDEKNAIRKFLANGRRVQGQTPDELRSGGLKIISRVLSNEIKKIPGDPYWKKFRVFTNEPRHLLRAIDPSAQDIIIAQRLGILAVDNAMAGYTDFMVSQWVTEYVLVPLQLVVLGRKRVPQAGIFWKSVVARTGYKGDPDPKRKTENDSAVLTTTARIGD